MESVDKREGAGSGKLKKSFSKIAFRGKERVMISLGIAEETKDEAIENYVRLLNKQQVQFHKFQRDMKQYLQSINAMKAAAENFYYSLSEVYDDAWLGKEMLSSFAQTTAVLYDNLQTQINIETIGAVQQHLNQCNEIKVKVQKRGRKLVDYDGTRRSYHTLKSARKVDESKLAKAKETMEQSRETYDTLNSQLHQELPDLYDVRVELCASVATSIATAEKDFYSELSELRIKLINLLNNVKDAYDNGDYRIQRLHPSVSQSRLQSEQSTLPADDVLGYRASRDRSESIANRSENGVYSQVPDDPISSQAYEESSHQAPVPAKRSFNEYVNVQIGSAEPTAFNGRSGENSHDDDDTDFDDKSTAEVATSPEAQVPAHGHVDSELSSQPQGGDRERTGSELEDVEAENEQLPTYSVVRRPSPADDPDMTSSVPVVRRDRMPVQEETAAEAKNKRSSLFETVGLNRLMSLARGSKPAQVKQDDVTAKSKPGLFSLRRFKKDKSASTLPRPTSVAGQSTSPKQRHASVPDQSAATLPPPSDQYSLAVDPTPHDDPPYSAVDPRAPSNVYIPPAANSSDDGSVEQSNGSDEYVDVTVGRSIESVSSEDGDVQAPIESRRYEPDRSGNDVIDEGLPVGSNPSDDFALSQISDSDADDTVQTPQLSGKKEDNVYVNVAELRKQEDSIQEQEDVARDSVDPIREQEDRFLDRDGLSPSESNTPDGVLEEEDAPHGGLEKSGAPGTFLEESDTPGGALEKLGTPDGALEESDAPDGGLEESDAPDGGLEESDAPDGGLEESDAPDGGLTELDARDSTQYANVLVNYALDVEEEEEEYVTVSTNSADGVGNKPLYEMPLDVRDLSESSEGSVSSYHSSRLNTPLDSVSLTDDEDILPRSDHAVGSGGESSGKTEDYDHIVLGLDANPGPLERNLTGETASESPAFVESHSLKTDAYDRLSSPGQIAADEIVYENITLNAFPARGRPGAQHTSTVQEPLADDNDDSLYEEIVTSSSHASNPHIYDKPDSSDEITNPDTPEQAKVEQEILPPYFLYKVEAMYPYQGADEDELSFKKGDVIYVVEHPDPEEQDEGWQMGILKSRWENSKSTSGMAVFPENFSRRM